MMPIVPVSPRWRSLLRLSVRGLIVLVLVIGSGLGWIVRTAQVQREAVAAIESAGGFIAYDWQWSNRTPVPRAQPLVPSWLVDLVGLDYFGHVNVVCFPASSTATDLTIEQVERLSQIEELILTKSFGDAGVVHLQGLSKLSSLDLFSTKTTDAGLVHLKELKNLTYLNLAFTHVTDAGLLHLKGLSNLSVLDVSGTQVTDSGIEELKQALPSLTIRRR